MIIRNRARLIFVMSSSSSTPFSVVSGAWSGYIFKKQMQPVLFLCKHWRVRWPSLFQPSARLVEVIFQHRHNTRGILGPCRRLGVRAIDLLQCDLCSSRQTKSASSSLAADSPVVANVFTIGESVRLHEVSKFNGTTNARLICFINVKRRNVNCHWSSKANSKARIALVD